MYDCIIVGAGPGGLTAALYAGRYRLNTLVLEKITAGGQILMSPSIENFPGFPGGISTAELMERMTRQVEEVGVKIESQEVVELDTGGKANSLGFSVKTNEAVYEAKSVIIASGAQPKRLAVPGEELLTGRGVSYCGTCDGPLFRNKELVVVGGGDRAIEEALFLTEYASKVSVIHRREGFRASEIMMEKARNNPKIEFILGCTVEEIFGRDRVSGIKIKDVFKNVRFEKQCNGVFIFVGIEPNTGFVKDKLEKDAAGFIITEQNMGASKEGIFACGDCRKRSLYQVISACGEGAIAADSAHKYVRNYA
ncbi:MAG: thioredoxin-disulfide reductase [Candidatus Omnitrophota bacterium]|jgi:thioredoxin reductase (NADPH)